MMHGHKPMFGKGSSEEKEPRLPVSVPEEFETSPVLEFLCALAANYSGPYLEYA